MHSSQLSIDLATSVLKKISREFLIALQWKFQVIIERQEFQNITVTCRIEHMQVRIPASRIRQVPCCLESAMGDQGKGSPFVVAGLTPIHDWYTGYCHWYCCEFVCQVHERLKTRWHWQSCIWTSSLYVGLIIFGQCHVLRDRLPFPRDDKSRPFVLTAFGERR